MKIPKALLMGVLATVSIWAQATVITFDSEIEEAKPNGYTVEGVTFFDTVGEDLFVGTFAQSNGSRALAVLIDDDSFLAMAFPAVSNFLSLDFGNDNPQFTNPGDVALLTLFLGGAQVGQIPVLLNRDGLMNQTIALAGIDFDVASFGFADSGFAPINLTEVVDNITFLPTGTVPAPVPEPASLALLGLGAAVAALARRKAARGRMA